MKKIISIVLGVLFLLTLTGCSLIPRTTKVTGNRIIEKVEDYSSKITKTVEFTKRNKMIIIAKNENSIDLDITFEVEFYDEKNALITSEKSYLTAVGSGSEVAVQIYDTPKSYYRYQVYTDAKVNDYCKTYFNNIELIHNRSDNVVAQATNNSNETIDYMTAAVIYYQGNEVVGFDSTTASDVKPGRSGNFTFYDPYDENYNDVTYDNYKVIINEAYSYSYSD